MYIGNSSGLSPACDHGPDWEEARGNSILLDMGEGRLVFVGWNVFSFQVRGLAPPGRAH